MIPFEPMRNLFGQELLSYARQIEKSLSTTTGQGMRWRFVPMRTFSGLYAKSNSGA